MSFQRHFKRNEIWLISEGSCTVSYSDDISTKIIKKIELKKFDHYLVPVKHWHQISNTSNERLHIIEIQYGEVCHEDDIERENTI